MTHDASVSLTGLQRPRFVMLSDGLPNPADGGATPRSARVMWRLIAANNRPMGSSPQYYTSIEECFTSAHLAHTSAGEAMGSVQFHRSTSDWGWAISVAEVKLAVSARRYQRRVECERALRNFLDAVAVTTPTRDVRDVGPRLRLIFR
jgi:hypothetical protein